MAGLGEAEKESARNKMYYNRLYFKQTAFRWGPKLDLAGRAFEFSTADGSGYANSFTLHLDLMEISRLVELALGYIYFIPHPSLPSQ